jgi:hypothetical protein
MDWPPYQLLLLLILVYWSGEPRLSSPIVFSKSSVGVKLDQISFLLLKESHG